MSRYSVDLFTSFRKAPKANSVASTVIVKIQTLHAAIVIYAFRMATVKRMTFSGEPLDLTKSFSTKNKSMFGALLSARQLPNLFQFVAYVSNLSDTVFCQCQKSDIHYSLLDLMSNSLG